MSVHIVSDDIAGPDAAFLAALAECGGRLLSPAATAKVVDFSETAPDRWVFAFPDAACAARFLDSAAGRRFAGPSVPEPLGPLSKER